MLQTLFSVFELVRESSFLVFDTLFEGLITLSNGAIKELGVFGVLL